jgi:hypothetical protein
LLPYLPTYETRARPRIQFVSRRVLVSPPFSFRDAKVNVWQRSLNRGCRLPSLAEYLQLEKEQEQKVASSSPERGPPRIYRRRAPRNIRPHVRSCPWKIAPLAVFAKRVAQPTNVFRTLGIHREKRIGEGGGRRRVVARSSALWRSIIADDIHFSFYHHAS